MSDGSRMLAMFKRTLSRFGQSLSVATPPTTSAGTWGSYSDTFIPMKSPSDAPPTFYAEGGDNADNPNPWVFVCAGDGDIAVGHIITFKTQEYVVVDTNPYPLGGVDVGIAASTTRYST